MLVSSVFVNFKAIWEEAIWRNMGNQTVRPDEIYPLILVALWEAVMNSK